MREEYMIERHGKRFVLYAGLLEEAHNRGLRSIETELLQVPAVENGEVAIVKAVVRTEEGKFSGIGDASPENVSRTISPHIIRMAETRAKARALRDAINVSVTAFEELGGSEGNDGAEAPAKKAERSSAELPAAKSASGANGSATPTESAKTAVERPAAKSAEAAGGANASASEVAKGELPATRKQLNYLEALIGDVVDDGVPKFEEMVGKKVAELTREEASEWIGRLSGKAA